MYPQSMFLAKIRKKNTQFFILKFTFYSREILLYNARTCLRNVWKEEAVLDLGLRCFAYVSKNGMLCLYTI